MVGWQRTHWINTSNGDRPTYLVCVHTVMEYFKTTCKAPSCQKSLTRLMAPDVFNHPCIAVHNDSCAVANPSGNLGMDVLLNAVSEGMAVLYWTANLCLLSTDFQARLRKLWASISLPWERQTLEIPDQGFWLQGEQQSFSSGKLSLCLPFRWPSTTASSNRITARSALTYFHCKPTASEGDTQS